MATRPGAHIVSLNGHQSTRFGVMAPAARQVWLCIFDAQGGEHRHPMQRAQDGGWQLEHDECPVGTQYGFRADGPFEPAAGLWYNPAKLLIDPFAKSISATHAWHRSLYEPFAQQKKPRPLEEDSAAYVAKSIVVDGRFDWRDDVRPEVPWNQTVIYELHVKGFTRQHPDIDESLRGSYLGLSQRRVIEHLRQLGITTVQLMPCSAFLSEQHLTDRGLSNYWGYNPIALFAPEPSYAVRDPVLEFKFMVRALHAAGIEVIMDIVLNHTAEGDHRGPTLSFKGLDNAAAYRLVRDQPMYYENHSGCGNALNTAHPRTLAFTLECLRYWVDEMHVDGFRFDLAASLGRDETGAFNPESAFFRAIAADPVLSRIKLIAEPWDVGPNGYQLGRFPRPWREVNGAYRDTVRGFWNTRGVSVGAFAERIAGSSDMYRDAGRTPTASVNFVTCHDGFTLHDLVSYAGKHNLANGENNQDGSDFNLSANHGAEGETENPGIRALREKQKRNLLATLALSQGVTHILAGDEFGHSQHGNNNAYCQDNEISWLDWSASPERNALLAFTRLVIALRKRSPGFRREAFLSGEPLAGQAHISAIKDVSWLHPGGREMAMSDWHNPKLRALGMLLIDQGPPGADSREAGLASGIHLLLFNASLEPVEFVLPEYPSGSSWTRIFDTSNVNLELPFAFQNYRLGELSCAAFWERLPQAARPAAAGHDSL